MAEVNNLIVKYGKDTKPTDDEMVEIRFLQPLPPATFRKLLNK